MIDQTLYDAFGQRQVATIYTSSHPVQGDAGGRSRSSRTDPTALSRIYVPGANGAQVPLSTVAHFTNTVAPLTVNHQGQFPAVTLSFNLAPGVALGQAVDAIKQHAGRPARRRSRCDGSFQGTAQAFQSSLSSTPLLVAAAILAVYIVLGMLYESYVHPITILSALPSAGVGALLALMLLRLRPQRHRADRHHPADRHRQEERDHDDRLRARGRARPRQEPAGGDPRGLPAALPADHDDDLRGDRSAACRWRSATGAGSELRRPLGIAIVGGLLVSQWLTLYTTPVIYLYLDRFAHWLSGKRRRPTGEVPATVPAKDHVPGEAGARAAD